MPRSSKEAKKEVMERLLKMEQKLNELEIQNGRLKGDVDGLQSRLVASENISAKLSEELKKMEDLKIKEEEERKEAERLKEIKLKQELEEKEKNKEKKGLGMLSLIGERKDDEKAKRVKLKEEQDEVN